MHQPCYLMHHLERKSDDTIEMDHLKAFERELKQGIPLCRVGWTLSELPQAEDSSTSTTPLHREVIACAGKSVVHDKHRTIWSSTRGNAKSVAGDECLRHSHTLISGPSREQAVMVAEHLRGDEFPSGEIDLFRTTRTRQRNVHAIDTTVFFTGAFLGLIKKPYPSVSRKQSRIFLMSDTISVMFPFETATRGLDQWEEYEFKYRNMKSTVFVILSRLCNVEPIRDCIAINVELSLPASFDGNA